MKRLITICIALILSVFLSACSPAISMQLTTTPFINPDQKNHALPLLIRIYQLSQSDSFNEATFHQLWLHDANILGTSLIDRQEIIINPNSTTTVKINPNKAAQYIGIIALYRNPKHSQWRLIKAMPERVFSVFGSLSVKISGHKMFLTSSLRDKQ